MAQVHTNNYTRPGPPRLDGEVLLETRWPYGLDAAELLFAFKRLSQAFHDLDTTHSAYLAEWQQGKNNYQETFQSLMTILTKVRYLWRLRTKALHVFSAAMMHDLAFQNDVFDLTKRMDSVSDRLEELADIQRKHFNDSIRGLARPLTISDIPDELLSQIFGHVRGAWNDVGLRFSTVHQADTGDTCSIKNVRLTCRRFCATSSHLLLRRVFITLDSASLAHLDELSRHPTLSKGIQAVCVHMCHLTATLAANELEFVDFLATEMRDQVGLHRDHLLELYGPAVLQESARPEMDSTDLERLYAIEKGRQVHNAWRDYAILLAENTVRGSDDIEGTAEKIAAVSSLRVGHQVYMQRVSEQQRLLESGALLRCVAEAMARMPTAVRLSMTDVEDFLKKAKRSSFRDRIQDLALFIREETRSAGWELDQGVNVASPPGRLLYSLPTAIYKSGVSLTGLDINISGDYYRHLGRLDDESRNSLHALAKTLKVLQYRGPPEYPRAPADQNPVLQYLTCLQAGERLTEFAVSFRPDRSETKDIGPLLTSLLPHTGLRLLTASDVSTHLHELQVLLPRLKRNLLTLELHAVHLESGTWAEALDLLREANLHAESTLWRPSGAECDFMSREEYAKIFDSPEYIPVLRPMSEAVKFMCNVPFARNPLVPQIREGSADIEDHLEDSTESLEEEESDSMDMVQ